MLDRNKLESGFRDSAGCECLKLTDLEIRLIKLYRQISEKDRKQVQRIAGYFAEPSDIE
ncbi:MULTISPECIES: hypothetical protein [Pseudomonas]|uniref:hypothetical protein n=1 Tax=Pseudomonas TaxID=286 RepID=UPI000AB442D3|nr:MULTISPECIES: hypothetical protein [Pseudomonas]MCU0211443.1 hypothetical protein [Pseudomonas shahriarae]NMY20566.1 hypothetical protein [Pseudomonas sp. WS 5410]